MANLLYVMSFFENQPPVGEYSYNPDQHHVTLLPEFAIPTKNLNPWLDSIQQVVQWHKSFLVQEEETIYLGDEKHIPAILVSSPDDALQRIHEDLLVALTQYEGKSASGWVGENFLPHISFKDNRSEVHHVHGFSVIWHREGFGADVVNLRNYAFTQ